MADWLALRFFVAKVLGLNSGHDGVRKGAPGVLIFVELELPFYSCEYNELGAVFLRLMFT